MVWVVVFFLGGCLFLFGKLGWGCFGFVCLVGWLVCLVLLFVFCCCFFLVGGRGGGGSVFSVL